MAGGGTARTAPRGPALSRAALFGECLLVGALTLAAGLALVTLPAALAAGCAHVRAHTDGEGGTALADFAGRLRAAWTGSWRLGLAVPALAAVLAADVLIVAAFDPPGGAAALAGCAAAGAGGAVLLVRAAAAWRPGRAWRGALRSAAVRAGADPTGTALLAVALGVCAVVTWAMPPALVALAGCLLLAAVVVDKRGGG
ncbi:Poxvirus protein I5 [Streptomonospora sp. PA3]|uniref:Poxvirus protein I5 n=1 Tax=Streptomonospora sp. PA3 TaxID=2607326 RepID=UPI0012DCCDFA|nr:Poxvirus protein I5 [Streptomonospora sp. PA3]MUL43529.1 Poxvirus protein I5 [Streptomonospora sp. PA3]